MNKDRAQRQNSLRTIAQQGIQAAVAKPPLAKAHFASAKPPAKRLVCHCAKCLPGHKTEEARAEKEIKKPKLMKSK